MQQILSFKLHFMLASAAFAGVGVPGNYVVNFCYIYQKFATSSKIGRSLLMSDHFVFMGIEGVLNKILHACHCNIHIFLFIYRCYAKKV